VGQFDIWDWRWNDGSREEDAAPFNRSIMDRRFIPTLGAAEDRVRRITDRSDLTLSLGRSTSSRLVNLGTSGFGGAFGLTRFLTIHGMVPLVAVKVQPRVLIDSTGATAAFNGASAVFGTSVGAAAASSFLGTLRAAIMRLGSNLTGGTYDSDPVKKALAQETLARAEALELELVALLTGPEADFVPRTGSPAGVALQAVITELKTILAQLDVTQFTGTLPLGGTPWGYADFEDYLTNLDGPIAAFGVDVPTLSYVGDIEVGAALALIDRFPSTRIGAGLRAVLDATVRLRTAQLDSPDRFFDVPTGDRQPDLDVSLTTDVGFGRFGARLAGGYNLQLPGNQNRRIAAPDQPIAVKTSLAGVRRDPGDVIRLSGHPFFRLAPYLSLYAGVDYWTKQADQFSYAAGQPPLSGFDPAVLGQGSESNAFTLSAGLSYSHAGLSKRGLLGLPMDASFRYQRIVRSTRGLVSDINTVRVDLRFYTRIFGRSR
jgi:hypothetical protein